MAEGKAYYKDYDVEIPETLSAYGYGDSPLTFVSLSDYNGMRKLQGMDSVDLLENNCTKSLARWLALRTIRSPLFFKNKSSSFFVYVILLSYHTQTITHKRTAMLMLSCFFILNNYISDFFIRPPPFRCLFLLFHLQTSFILGGSLWTNILILTER